MSIAINVGDEGGFAPSIDSVTQCLDLIMEAVKSLGYESKVKIAMDIAASGIRHHKSEVGLTVLGRISLQRPPWVL